MRRLIVKPIKRTSRLTETCNFLMDWPLSSETDNFYLFLIFSKLLGQKINKVINLVLLALRLASAVNVFDKRCFQNVLNFQVIPIVAHDDDSEELSEEELAKRREFERKRKEVATPEGLDIKAVLGHRIPIPGAEGDEDEEEEEEEEDQESDDEQNLQKEDGIAESAISTPPENLPNSQKSGDGKK